MDLERMKLLRNEYAERHIILREQFEKQIQELQYNSVVVPEPPQEKPQPNSTFDYAQMTRQQRRAYERRLAKENKRKH
jgi:hypothetical protein